MEILIVDDDRQALQYLEGEFSKQGHRISSVTNGREALDFIRQQLPDLVICAILIPGLDGFRLCREVKSIPQLRHIPFILFTAARVDEQDHHLAERISGFRIITKPCNYDGFHRELHQAVDALKARLHFSDHELGDIDHLYTGLLSANLANKVEELQETRHTLLKTNRSLKTLIESQKMLIRAGSEAELFHGLCQVLVDHGGYRLSWIGLAQSDQKKSVIPVAKAGINTAYLEKIRISWGDTPEGRGPTGRAIREGRPIIVHDIHTDERFARWRDAAEQHGYVASIALPFRRDPHTMGTLNIYADEPNRFDEKEVALLERLVDELVYGLHVMHEHQAHLEAEAALAEARLERSELLETIPDIAFKIDTDNRLVLWNKKTEQILGYRPDELYSMDIMRLFPENQQDRIREALRQTYELGHTVLDAELVARDNTVIPYQFIGSHIKDDSGRVIGIAGTGRDMTEALRAKQEKEQLQRRLQQTHKMEIIGQLTGGISHDFNNILTSILGYTDLSLRMLERGRHDRLPGYLNQVIEAGTRAKHLIEQMMQFSRASQTTGELQTIHIGEMLPDIINLLRPVLPSTIELVVTPIPEELPTVCITPVQVQQILMNLCLNAHDAMQDTGRIEITASRRQLDKLECSSCHQPIRGDYVVLSISDTGPGIAVMPTDRIFDPFFTTKDHPPGSGMGLAITHSLIHECGGHILVENSPQSGAEFRLLFPVQGRCTGADDEAAEDDTATDGQGKTVLIVDDEESISSFLKSVLELNNFTVHTFFSSEDALRFFKQHSSEIDLVITDQTMPAMTGLELAKEMRALREEMPIILVTGHEETNYGGALESKLIDAFIHKPFSIAELLTVTYKLSHLPPPDDLGGF